MSQNERKQTNLHRLFHIQARKEPINRPFLPKRAQIHYKQHATLRDLILKARQLGLTTQIKMDDMNEFMTMEDIRCITIADTQQHAEEIFTMCKYAFDCLPDIIKDFYKLDTNNTNKMRSSLTRSSIRITTSGRSGTCQRLHISEFSHMDANKKKEVMAGSLQTVPKEGYAVIETTANGMDEFFTLWNEALDHKNGWTTHFYAWFWDDEYTETPPADDKWKQDYLSLAKVYGLIPDIQTRFNLTDGQWYWYYGKVRELKILVKQEYPTIAEEAFLTTGSSVFDLVALQNLKGIDPIEMMYNGDLRIWKLPEKGHQYVIGADTSEGDPNSDYDCAEVLDVETGENVAELRGRWKDYIYAEKLALLGEWYDYALIAVERNNHGHSILNSLDTTELYKNLYEHDDEKYGFPTNAKTKPAMFDGSDGLVQSITDGLLKTNNYGFIRECYSFIYTTKSRKHGMGAESGAFDDRVMAMAIAWQIKRDFPSIKARSKLYVG